MLSCQLLVDEVNCFLEMKDEIVKNYFDSR
jgi:hypothetical protein